MNQWRELLVTQEVIDRVDYLTGKEKQLLIQNGLPIFEWISSILIDDDDDVPIINDSYIEG